MASAEESPPVLATVNGVPVTAAQVREMAMKNNHPLAKPAGFEESLKDAVNFEVLAGEALRLGYDKDPEIQKLVKAMAVQRLLKDKVESPAASPPASATPPAIAVSEDELKALYEKSKAEYTQPTLVRGQVLFLLKRKDKEEEFKKRLADAQAETKAGTPFGNLVAKFSDNPAAQANGGMTQWLVEGQEDKQYPREVTAALFSAKDPAAVAGPIMAGQGAYFVKLAERRQGKTLSFDEVRRVLHERLYRQKASAAYDQYVATLLAGVKIERNAEAIAAMQKALAEEAGGPPAGPVTIRPAAPPATPERPKSPAAEKPKSPAKSK